MKDRISENEQAPVTVLDLALLSEDALVPERRAYVLRVLNTDTDCSGEFAELGIFPSDSAQPAPSQSVAPLRYAAATDLATRTPSGSPARRWWKNLTLAAGVCVLVMIGILSQMRLANAHSALGQLEQFMEAGTPVNSPEIQTLVRRLEAVGSSYFFSRENRERRAVVLGQLYLEQAEFFIDHQNISDYSGDFSEFPGIRLCEKSIFELKRVDSSAAENRTTLIEAYYTLARIQYLFGTLNQRRQSAGDKILCMYDCGKSLLAGLQLLNHTKPAEANVTWRVRLGGLLAKSIHKGMVNGARAQNNGLADAALLQEFCELFPAVATLGLQEQLPEGDAALVDLVPCICQSLIDTAAELPQQPAALLEVYNILGLNRRNLGLFVEAEMAFRQGIELAQQFDQLSETGAMLSYGRLLGNRADLSVSENQLDEALQWGGRAIEVFRTAAHKDRNSEAVFELGWVTARQLIAAYCRARQDSDELPPNVIELLGSLRNASNNLRDFSGFQLLGPEIEWIHAINAHTYRDADLYQGGSGTLTYVRAMCEIRNVPKRRPHLRFVQSRLHGLAKNPYLQGDADFQTAMQIIDEACQRAPTESNE